jgi:hypothetical protein
MPLANLVLDIYDDPRGEVLVNALDRLGLTLTEKVASSKLASQDELARLPNRLFALVTSDGMRKFAMHDEAHLQTSILYFLEASSRLTDEARVKVATNLVNACAWYDEVEPPIALVKIAVSPLSLGMGALAASGGVAEVKGVSAKNRDIEASFRAAQQPKTASIGVQVDGESAVVKGETKIDQLAKDRAGVDSDMRSTRQLQPIDATAVKAEEPGPFGHAIDKKADLNGTSTMSYVPLDKKKPAKVAHLVVGGSAYRPAEKVAAVHKHFALPAEKKYPIDTEDHVKLASAYFDENWKYFSPVDRREFAANVTNRAELLGLKVAGKLLDYGGDDYGSYIDTQLLARVKNYECTGMSDGYQALYEKRAAMDPSDMALSLLQMDELTGASRSWGAPLGFLDPFAATFGKEAEEKEAFSWTQGNDYVNEDMLTRLSSMNAKLDDVFGNGFALRFQKSPVGTFKSLTDPQKVILARLAADNRT